MPPPQTKTSLTPVTCNYQLVGAGPSTEARVAELPILQQRVQSHSRELCVPENKQLATKDPLVLRSLARGQGAIQVHDWCYEMDESVPLGEDQLVGHLWAAPDCQ